MTQKQCYLGTYVMSSFLVHLFSIAMPTPPHVNRNSVLFLLVGASCCSSLLVLHHRHPLETGRVTRKPGLSLSDLKQLCSSSSREHLQLSSSVSHVAHIGHDKEIGHSTPPAQVADIGHERPIAFVFMISNACLLAPINKMHWNQFLI